MHTHNRKIYNLHKKLKNYEDDKDKEKREKNYLCKWCYYIDVDKIVMNVLTTQICRRCAKPDFSANSDVDMYCIECAKELNVCKHCGSIMD